MPPMEPDFAEMGRKLFAREAEFYWAAARAEDLPPRRGLEIAFAGRSNVGKSSLINALTGRNSLARTSNTPGRTQQLNFFDLAGALSIVDMPGYGYAAVGKDKVSAWTGMIHAYLSGRVELGRVLLLIDARHGIKDTDKPVLETLAQAAVSYQVILTKSDALSKPALSDCVEAVRLALKKQAAVHPDILATSSRLDAGMVELRAALARLLVDRKMAPAWMLEP
jgi:GTP-binding protein